MADARQRSNALQTPAPEPEDVLRAAGHLHDLISDHGASNDREGRIAAPVMDQLYAIGAIGVFSPRALGGAEMTPRQAMDLLRTLSYADPSTGWVTFALGFATGLAGAFLDRDTAEELYATPRLGIAGQGTRAGTAVPVDGGYLVSGAWSFASGIRHANHVLTAANVSGTGEPRCFILPLERVNVVDNWDVLGLRGTGSIDYTLQDAFVPTNYSFATLSTEPVTGGDLYRIGIGNFASINHGAWAIGVGRRLLDELAADVRIKGGHAAGDAFMEDYADAEVRLRAAKAFLYEVWEEVEELLAGGGPLPLRAHTLIRAALNNATWRSHEVAQFVYAASGTAALRNGTVQRLFRDMHGGTQHISSSRIILQSAGRELAGLAEGRTWVHHALK
ncbi:acyl-CoA dehydrogenase [Streptomyces sp. NPDC048290]|uniref:acyl-CoA dehydrogenase n=1 Tax=Streptomyces sp. NPDC048290 TaxID=3155811 RepID=UPI00343A7029